MILINLHASYFKSPCGNVRLEGNHTVSYITVIPSVPCQLYEMYVDSKMHIALICTVPGEMQLETLISEKEWALLVSF
jgi:hypothetical protein